VPVIRMASHHRTYRRSVIVRQADILWQQWSSALLVMPPPFNNSGSSRPSLAPGVHTADHELCRTDDGHRTIPTAATSPIHPALDRPSCASLMPYHTYGYVTIPSSTPPHRHKILRSGCSRHHRGGHKNACSPRSPASFPRPRHHANCLHLHGLRFSPMIAPCCAWSAAAPGADLIPW
jgi:hypothetical protein